MLKDFEDRLRNCRKKANITQAECARRIGVTPQAWSKWETGQGLPDLDYVPDICKVLHTTSDSLLGISGDLNFIGEEKDEIITKAN